MCCRARGSYSTHQNCWTSKLRGGDIDALQATDALAGLGATRVVRWPHRPLQTRVWELRHNLTAYDASYVALAETFDGPTLLTGDGGIAEVAKRSLGSEGVHLLR